MPKSSTSFKPGNQKAARHNGESAVKAITAGQELTGPARAAELEVYNELATEGRASIVLRLAVRLTAAADLFHTAMVEAAQRGDLERMDSYTKRFGWLAASALRGWQQVAAEEKAADSALDYERILQEQQDQ